MTNANGVMLFTDEDKAYPSFPYAVHKVVAQNNLRQIKTPTERRTGGNSTIASKPDSVKGTQLELAEDTSSMGELFDGGWDERADVSIVHESALKIAELEDTIKDKLYTDLMEVDVPHIEDMKACLASGDFTRLANLAGDALAVMKSKEDTETIIGSLEWIKSEAGDDKSSLVEPTKKEMRRWLATKDGQEFLFAYGWDEEEATIAYYGDQACIDSILNDDLAGLDVPYIEEMKELNDKRDWRGLKELADKAIRIVEARG